MALGCRCPRCGVGPLYQGVLTVRPLCITCGLDLSAEDAGDGAAVFVILILGALVMAAALIVENLFQPPVWVHILLWTPIILGGSILMLRPLKAALVAQQYRSRTLPGALADDEPES